MTVEMAVGAPGAEAPARVCHLVLDAPRAHDTAGPDRPRAESRHPATALMLIICGHGVHHDAGGARRLAPGTLLLVAAGSPHRWEFRSEVRALRVEFPDRALRRELSWVRELRGSGEYFADRAAQRTALPARSWQLDARLSQTVQQRVGELERAPGREPFRSLGPLMSLFEVLDPLLATPPEAPRRAEPEDAAPVRPRGAVSERVHEILAADPTAGWTLETIAQQVHLSPSQLNRVMRAELGITALTYLRRLRCEYMAELLRTSDMPVRAIGAAVGWHDTRYATRRFREHWGMLPSQYRASLAD